MSRVARVLFAPELLLRLTRGKFEVVENPVPATATWKYCAYDVERGAVFLVVEDASFAEVAPGEVIPFLEPPMIHVLVKAAR